MYIHVKLLTESTSVPCRRCHFENVKLSEVNEMKLPGGNAGGAWRVGDTVRRQTGKWTPSVHELLRYLEVCQFDGAPRVYGIDDKGREVLSFLAGESVGDRRPWPKWVHSDQALIEVGQWLRRYHDTVSSFVVPFDSHWRGSTRLWQSGDVICHNDAAPYNAIWSAEPKEPCLNDQSTDRPRLIGFIDWDFAAPQPPIWDLAFVASSWVPLHAREVAVSEGFEDFTDRPRRLGLLLDSYGYLGSIGELLEAVRMRINDHIRVVRVLAEGGDPLFKGLIQGGVIAKCEQTLIELEFDFDTYEVAFRN